MEPLPQLPLESLRRLARGLLYDDHRAEDVVQEAWLAALRRQPDAAVLPAWMRTAVRNLALNVRREEERRESREARVARSPLEPDSSEVLAQVEVQRRVLDALAALDEPYRSAVGLRYLEDQPPRAIARKLGLPVNTVRTHLRRGLAELRRKLERGTKREDLLAALAPLAGSMPTSVALEPILPGLIVAGTLSLVTWVFWNHAGKSGALSRAIEPSTVKSATSASTSATDSARNDEGANTFQREPAIAAQPVVLCSILATSLAEGRPLVDATVRVLEASGEQRVLRADATGVVELERSALLHANVEVRAEGFFPRSRWIEWPSSSESFVLHPNGELRVRVLEEDGRPVAGAFVQVEPEQAEGFEPWTRINLESSITDGEGEVLLGPFPCDVSLKVTARDAVPPTAVVARIPLETRWDTVEIRVLRHGCIRGRLVWEDGTPAVGDPTPAFPRSLTGDDVNRPVSVAQDGSFELCGLPLGWVRWCVQHNGGPQHRLAERVDWLGQAVLDVGVVRLTRPTAVEGRVVSRNLSAPLLEGLQLAYLQDGREAGRGLTRVEGRFEDIVPLGEVELRLLSHVGLLMQRRLVAPTSGVVLDLDTAVAALRVEGLPVGRASSFEFLLSYADSPDDEEAPRLTWDTRGGPTHDLLWQDESLLLPFLRAGLCDLYLRSARGPIRFLGRLDLAPGQTSVLQFDESAPSGISGQLVDSAGAGVPEASLIAWLRGAWDESRVQVMADSTGRFSIEDLAAGLWMLQPADRDGYEPVRVELSPGQRYEVQVRCETPGSLFGRVTRGDVPLPGIKVYLARGTTTAITGQQGEFAFPKAPPGRHTLVIRVNSSSGAIDLHRPVCGSNKANHAFSVQASATLTM